MLVALDIETSANGVASFQWFRHDFKIDSLALTYEDGTTWFSTDTVEITQKLCQLSKDFTPLIVHNLQFEGGVFYKLYPDLKFNWYADTMRLAQLYDAGGQDIYAVPILTLEQSIAIELGEVTEEEVEKQWGKSKGIGLEACALRLLPAEYHNHKAVAHDYLAEHHGIKSKHGQYLHLLPYETLKAYNIADTNITFALYRELIQRLAGFDWQKDWQLYTLRIEHMNYAYHRGIKIDRDALYQYLCLIEQEIELMEGSFLAQFEDKIEQIRDRKLLELVEWANDPGVREYVRVRRFDRLARGDFDKDWAHFNVGSSKQLQELFCEVLGITPKFLTPKGQPSFKSSHLNQWGNGGQLLLKRKKRLLVLQQAANVYLSSEYDGRTHPQVRAAGTRTGRVAGGTL